MELCDLTIHELKRLYVQRKVLASEVLTSVVRRIEAVEEDYETYLTLDLENAFEQARAVDLKIKAGKTLGELEGIPVAIQDNLCQAGKETTGASRILKGFVPPYTATSVQNLMAHGAIILGRTNMDELALSPSIKYSVAKKSKNIWDPQRSPGGSSGGSAVAVGETISALGSDTGGLLRQAAAFCGVTGFRPTYGLVSRYGLVAFASSLDQIGPLAKDTEDSAIMLNVLVGFDPLDSTSVQVENADYTKGLEQDLAGRKIGLPIDYVGKGSDEAVKEKMMDAVGQLKDLGAEIVDLSLTLMEYALPAYYIISSAEASSNLARFDGIRYGQASRMGEDLTAFYTRTRSEGFGREVKRRIMLGTYVLNAGRYETYYQKAQQVRTLIIQEFKEAFRQVDAIITPTSPTTAFKLGEKSEDPLQMYLSNIFTVPASMAGLPAISVPCGFSCGLPVGMQIIGRPFAETTVLNIAHQYQKVTTYHCERPPGVRKEGSA